MATGLIGEGNSSLARGKQQGCSVARATRGLLGNAASRRREGGRVRTGNRPSLDARSLAQPCYLPEEQHRPPEGEREKDTKGEHHTSSHGVPDWEATKRQERVQGQDRLVCSQSPHDETVVARCAQFETILPLTRRPDRPQKE